jgi:hypothetical protein
MLTQIDPPKWRVVGQRFPSSHGENEGLPFAFRPAIF